MINVKRLLRECKENVIREQGFTRFVWELMEVYKVSCLHCVNHLTKRLASVVPHSTDLMWKCLNRA